MGEKERAADDPRATRQAGHGESSARRRKKPGGQHSSAGGPENQTAEEIVSARRRLAFEFGVGRRYHSKRREAFRILDQGSKLVTVGLGSAVVYEATSPDADLRLVLGLLVMLAGVLPIILRWSERATEHRLMVWEYTELGNALVNAATTEEIAAIERRLMIVERDEEEPLQALARLCDIEESYRSGTDADEMEERPMLYRRIVAPWCDLPGGLPKPRSASE